jgi:hypothetical protein
MTPNGALRCQYRPSCHWEATWGGRSSQGQMSLVLLMTQGGRRAHGTIQSTSNHQRVSYHCWRNRCWFACSKRRSDNRHEVIPLANTFCQPLTVTAPTQRTPGVKYDPLEVWDAAQQLKINKYANLARNKNHEFVPLVAESLGGLFFGGGRLSSSSAK